MSRERAQALVEAVAAMPVCLACAMALVDGGILVRDRIATAQAATHAAEARLEGRDARAAARGALPSALQQDFRIDADEDRLVLRTRSRPTLGLLARRHVEHRSAVDLEGSR